MKIFQSLQRKRQQEQEQEGDRLSNLPDDIIDRVLYFLDAVSAVQTSVLSKRFIYLWTSLPVLKFHDPLLFHSFVDHFLSLRDASTNVHALNFTCHDELDDDGHVVDSIIDYVTLTPTISTSIQILSILTECVVEKLPQLSICQSLTTLKFADISTETPTTFDFVSLERLCLFDCRFECGEEEELDLFRGCVSLRCLFLHDCQYYGRFRRFKIFAPHLVDFSIKGMRVDEVFGSDCVVELFAAKLQSFSYRDTDLYDFFIELNLSFLERVDIAMDYLAADAGFSLP
ncbi:hypothetical protein AAZX31_17G076400 [Glycine max]|uniref:F-box domain-containing protein n=2 Tax=Glycine subgen. Soja TaxID=1462606 RepID=K7MKI1_SOYBN|nr:putative FBD-associated F-box protein At5g56820 [Glycine max]XP_028209683.1 putative FBD-associated F-box protein At5g56820 [Glycine soja]KAH1117370.1 hypothetical protein GYH30_046595 [Glycine max]KHN18359.1 Putative F-box/FBD/LRR-repeat protein [Glycine soja]KRH03138.1 hypothetical protein GLYMA_17G078800v4 [Glycine max]RZB55811.1 hypothetical protein D0Y65_045200 [Glycine soja]RZB55812.1 hypothetical protein D0Y65_045200 [Glycine soja]|eukprot:XP_025982108.1 putative FBD-associated F-box protein At5g56820 [Glycine max]